jgi:exopolysaccharide biosynthesis polyprenyl glycosylphosphotransferase
MDGASIILKRMLDIFGSLIGIILVSPIMLVAALLVKITSRGPILYRQERMGLDGRPFMILKFRSMPVDAEKKSGAVWATANDQRPTWIGRVMRKTSIDELPQLFNILAGQMSLVGPRPERPVFVEDFRKQIPGYMLRHKVKAGLTGWAQVNGWRGNTSLEKRIEFDLFYIQNWSIWMDIKIILMTCVRIFFDRNAY